MKLYVFVNDQPVATLESTDTFKHVLTYHPDVESARFVSLLMPVRTESYAWPELHPIFRMNLPEGFLLSILMEELGPQVGASPLNLLSVVGRNSIGRIKVATPGSDPARVPVPFDLKDVLRGDNSEEAFVDLVRRHAVSGVSGVVPKFLSPLVLGDHGKGTIATEHYIVKGTTARLPGVALNEHLCMQVARTAGIPTATTEVSDDGQVLLVRRFDYEADGVTHRGMEDLCSLLTLRPEQKYDSNWVKISNRIKDIVTIPAQQNAALSRLGDLLLLSLALRNADCHTKNMALLYSSRDAIEFAPVYDMLTITAYDDYAKNPPGMEVEGRSTWSLGKSLELFMQVRCFIAPQETHARIERICEAIVSVSPTLFEAAAQHSHFRDTAKRMLNQWNAGMNSLRLRRTWSLPNLTTQIEAARFSDIKPSHSTMHQKIGQSELLGRR
jgi:serine/threonine-protein kinase HipA